MNVESDLRNYISNEVILEPTGKLLDSEEPLISSGKVDSVGLLRIVHYILERYGVDILPNAGPEDFETIRSLVAVIDRSRSDVEHDH